MKTTHFLCGSVVAGLFLPALLATEGPYSPEDWPASVDPNATVHFVDTEGLFYPLGALWYSDMLQIRTGGDQVTEDITIGGHHGKQVTGNFLNVADTFYQDWATQPVIDILVQVYGNEALLNAAGEPRDYTFLTGVLPDLNFPVGGQIPAGVKNGKWNWVLFRIPNDPRPLDGERYIGSIPGNAAGDYSAGGVNGGTIRFEGVPGLIVRVIAFGSQGAFGEPEQVNKFLPADACDPEPETNLVGIDIDAGTSDHLVVLDDGDQTVMYADDVGPADDQRRAVAPTGSFLNFGITGNYLGQPCNDPRTVKVCVEFYDDPLFAGANVRFGPEAYATDALGGVAVAPAASRHVMAGSGQWIRRSFTVPGVNLFGVNAGGLTAGPRFISENGLVWVSRLQMAVLRTGDHPLAGVDPLEDCVADPNICTDAYGNYVELDLQSGLNDGLAAGSSGGDQEMIIEEAGPAGDRRMAVRPAHDDGTPGFQHHYLNFAILDEALGPNSQPPAHLAICVTYYDDPALTGALFRPEVYQTEVNGSLTLGFTSGDVAVAIEGTDTWRTAYWEIPNVKFNGVNQGPQAAARFFVGDKIFFTNVKYAVIRPCGPLAGVNLLEGCKPPPDDIMLTAVREGGDIRILWPAEAMGFVLQETTSLTDPQWAPVVEVPEVVDGSNVVTQTIEGEAKFYRLIQ
ncbi:MAG: hypothetical protein H7A46_01970 [Verrucomicrobiales bacterium]|nr:hypothetical protein [Verrucomicrobiales bacterium]